MGVTLFIERWGGRLGGAIGTLPSTIVPAALGMAAATPDAATFVRAIDTAPVGILLNALFLFLWRHLPPRLATRSVRVKLALMVALSLSAWLLAAGAMVAAVGRLLATCSAQLIGLLTTAALFVTGLAACRRDVPAPRGHNPVGPATLVGRGLVAATAVGASAALAATGVELVAGMAAVFPAIFLTTMVSLWLSQGEAVPAGAVGPMMLGSTSVAVFCLVVAETLPRLGPVVGTLVAWVASATSVTVPVSIWLHRRAAGQATR